MKTAIQRNWSREEIAEHGGARSWPTVAQELLHYWQQRGLPTG
jgi:hypothetical protein